MRALSPHLNAFWMWPKPSQDKSSPQLPITYSRELTRPKGEFQQPQRRPYKEQRLSGVAVRSLCNL